MDAGKNPSNKNIDILFKEQSEDEAPRLVIHSETGPSSLYGRVNDNVSYHSRDVINSHGLYQRMWSWVWKDLVAVFFGIFRIFSLKKNK